MNILGVGQEISGLVLLVVTSIRMEDEYKRVSFVPLRIGTHVLIAPLKWHVEQVEYIMFFYRAFVYFVVSIGHNAISFQKTPTLPEKTEPTTNCCQQYVRHASTTTTRKCLEPRTLPLPLEQSPHPPKTATSSSTSPRAWTKRHAMHVMKMQASRGGICSLVTRDWACRVTQMNS